MQREQVKKAIDITEEITALLEEIKKLPDNPDVFDSHCAVEYAHTIRCRVIALRSETDRLYREIVKL